MKNKLIPIIFKWTKLRNLIKDYGKFDASGKPVMSAVVSDTTAVKP